MLLFIVVTTLAALLFSPHLLAQNLAATQALTSYGYDDFGAAGISDPSYYQRTTLHTTTIHTIRKSHANRLCS
jgi:hypothetical protein